MQNMDNALAAFEIGSIALGYHALAVATRNPGVRPLDASALDANRFLLLIEGRHEDLKAAALEVRKLCETYSSDLLCDLEILERKHPALLPALFSLAQVELGECLVVVESDSVSGLLAMSQVLLQNHGLEAIELKIGRGLHGKAMGFFTGPNAKGAVAAEDARTRLKQAMREGRVEFIESPPAGFRQFFNLGG